MNLQLAITKACHDTGCHIQFLSGEAQTEAVFADPLGDYGISVVLGDLVAVDIDTVKPRIVLCWHPTRVKRVDEGQIYLEGESAAPHRIADGMRSKVSVGDEVYPYFGHIVGVVAGGVPADPEQLSAFCFPQIHAMYESLDLLYEQGPKQTVEQGYDLISERYEAWIQTVGVEIRERYLARLIDRLPADAKVLDLGCGSGIPVTQQLAQHFQITGVDISARQLERARQAVPQAAFIKADMAQVTFASASFDGIAAIGSIIHVPRDEHPGLLHKMATWLRPGGILLATFGTRSMKVDFEAGWLGTLMFWSYFDSSTNISMVEKAGFTILSADEESQIEDGQSVTFLWILAQKSD